MYLISRTSKYWELQSWLQFLGFSAEDRRRRISLIKSTTPCDDTEVAGLYLGLDTVYLTVLPAESEDYSTAANNLKI